MGKDWLRTEAEPLIATLNPLFQFSDRTGGVLQLGIPLHLKREELLDPSTAPITLWNLAFDSNFELRRRYLKQICAAPGDRGVFVDLFRSYKELRTPELDGYSEKIFEMVFNLAYLHAVIISTISDIDLKTPVSHAK